MWQQLSGSVQYLINNVNWRASETLTGLTQLKIGDVCLSVCMDVRKAFLYFDPPFFVLAPRAIPSQTSLNSILWFCNHYRITLEIELFTTLNCFGVQLKLKNLWELHFYSS